MKIQIYFCKLLESCKRRFRLLYNGMKLVQNGSRHVNFFPSLSPRLEWLGRMDIIGPVYPIIELPLNDSAEIAHVFLV